MNTAQRMLPYARQYVIIAIYEILEHDGVPYKKTDSSTVVFHGNKGIFSVSVSEQVKGTQLFVTMEQANAALSQAGSQRAINAVTRQISDYIENETVMAKYSPKRIFKSLIIRLREWRKRYE